MHKSIDTAKNYDLLADEYYDTDHLTTRNFDDSTARYLARVRLMTSKYLKGTVVDVGSGRGQLAHYFPGHTSAYRYEVDLSRKMLDLPRQSAIDGRIHASAFEVPLRDSIADLVTAFLFDPFNVAPIEKEMRRITRPDGLFIGTLPSIEWALPVRTAAGLAIDRTQFCLRDGTVVEAPSFVSSHSELRDRFATVGFSDVAVFDIAPSMSGRPLSRHVLHAASVRGVEPDRLGLVTVVLCK